MISEFASFIELFAAIYLTISLDDLLLRRFWTPDYAKRLERGLESISIPNLAKRPTLSSAVASSKKEENRSRKRGALMFALMVLLLIIIGYEETISQIGQIGQAFLYLSLFVLTLIIYVFDFFFLRKWLGVLCAVIFLSLFVIIVCCFLPSVSFYKAIANRESPLLVSYAKASLVFTLVFPVFWQLLRNRIYTHYYLSYILGEVNDKANEYNNALMFDTKKGHKMSKVATPYLDVTGQAIASGDGDRPIKPFLDVLLGELSRIVYVPSLFPLLKYSYKTFRDGHYPKRKLKKYYKEYTSRNPLPKMEKFCEEKGIDYNAFHDFHIRRIK